MLSAAEVAALIGAGVALVGMAVNWRKSKSDTVAQTVDALSSLLKDFSALRDQLEASEDQEEDCQQKLAEMRRELSRVLGNLQMATHYADALKSAFPGISTASAIGRRAASVRRVLDACRDGIVLSEIDGGKLLFVNQAFAKALGMTPEEVIAADWRTLIHPDDLHDSSEAESEAWSDGGEISNRYRHADGSYVRMRWHFTSYDPAGALSVVWFERRRDSRG